MVAVRDLITLLVILLAYDEVLYLGNMSLFLEKYILGNSICNSIFVIVFNLSILGKQTPFYRFTTVCKKNKNKHFGYVM